MSYRRFVGFISIGPQSATKSSEPDALMRDENTDENTDHRR